jgi:hypothetical protein
LTSFHLVSRWKAQQALQFARTQQQKQLKDTTANGTAPINITTTSNKNGRSAKDHTNKSNEEAENNDVEQNNYSNDDSDDDIDDFDNDDRY